MKSSGKDIAGVLASQPVSIIPAIIIGRFNGFKKGIIDDQDAICIDTNIFHSKIKMV